MSPDLEAIAALEPDLIVSVRHDALYDELSKVAPHGVRETTGPQWQKNTAALDEALGAEDEATGTLTAYRQSTKQVGDAINAKAGNVHDVRDEISMTFRQR